MLGYESEVVNGQLVNVAPKAAYKPMIFGPMFATGGMWPRQGVYNIPPVLPSPSTRADEPEAMSAYGNLPFPTASSETGNPYHPTKSPLWWALGFLVFSLFMLHVVHFKG